MSPGVKKYRKAVQSVGIEPDSSALRVIFTLQGVLPSLLPEVLSTMQREVGHIVRGIRQPFDEFTLVERSEMLTTSVLPSQLPSYSPPPPTTRIESLPLSGPTSSITNAGGEKSISETMRLELIIGVAVVLGGVIIGLLVWCVVRNRNRKPKLPVTKPEQELASVL